MERPSLDPLRQEKAKEYAGIVRRLFFFQHGLSVGILLAFLLSGLSEGLRDLLDFPRLAAVALYVLILMAAYGAILAPLGFYRGFVLPHRYGLSEQSLKSWLFDLAKSGTLGLLLGVSVLVAIYWLLDSFADTWWFFAAVLTLLLSLLLTMLAPLVLIPLFFKLEPLKNADLAGRLMRLARTAKVKIREVSVINLSSRTTAGNAMVAGLGTTRRVILGDTVLDKYSDDEIEVIVAHEFGHHSHRDITRLIGIQAALTLLGFYLVSLALGQAVPWLGLDSVGDVAAFPVFILALGAFNLLTGPFTNAYSRRLETAADEYALSLSGKPEAFVDMMTRLANQNLSDATPGRWDEVLFYDHPPYSKRVQSAVRHSTDGG